jgi:hypothetical protein
MIEISGKLNPEVKYLYGDMRTIRLNKCFDAVAIPDSIGHMTTVDELRKVILMAYKHIRSGGVLLIVAHISEEFKENNFIYTGSKGDVEVTLFENNHFPDTSATTYEATFVFLIRRKGKLEIHYETNAVGIFKLSTWLHLLKEIGFEVNQIKLEHSYDRFLIEEGEYPLLMFVCSKPL